MRRSPALTLLALFLWLPLTGNAEPLDLRDPNARWVAVQFEVSPAELPGQRDTLYSVAFHAWFEHLPNQGLARLTVGSEIVEHLLRERDPVPGTFSDFVWIFDPKTGAVVSAEVAGALREEARWGWIRKSATTHIRVSMDTERPAGFHEAQSVLGNQIFRFCEAHGDANCTLVPGRRLDPQRGYVNAVGGVTARTSIVSIETFSPLGEAIFSELHPPTPAVSAAGAVVGHLTPVAASSEFR